MKISLRVFLGFFLIVGLLAYVVMNTFMQEVKPGVRQGMEVVMVDMAQLLAEIAAPELKAGTLQDGALAAAIRTAQSRHPNARIWGLLKDSSDLRIYITNARGVVVFDSEGILTGQDFSRMNDVYLTLQGRYGARSTRLDPQDESTSVMHVAAPVLDEGQLIGVLTVATPTSNVVPYAQRSQNRVFRAGLALMGGALLIGIGLSLWLTRSINRLMDYARRVSEGQKAVMPAIGGGELADLGRALETMRNRLEDRQYVERYVHALTHEMKSPLAAIRGASELLEDRLPEQDRLRFVAMIREHEERLRTLIERMLGLVSVEQRQALENPVRLSLADLVERVVQARAALSNGRFHWVQEHGLQGDAMVLGEAFLLEQALANLLDNAQDFSPEGGRITVRLEAQETWCTVTVLDEGSGIPDFALDRIFEPFYSLPRPDTHKKSTGLGLSFVRQVAELHRGTIALSSRPEGGVEARLRLPRA